MESAGIDLHDAALDPAAQVVAGGGDGVAVQRDIDAHLALDVVLDGVKISWCSNASPLAGISTWALAN